MTPIKAIRAKCLDCCCGSQTEVKLCTCPDCGLYPFRMGHNPNIKREYTEEQRRAAAERLTKNKPLQKAAKAPNDWGI